MGEKPGARIDQGRPLVRPYRPRKFTDGPNGPVPFLEPDDPRHGTANGYGNFGCRCAPCTQANTDAQADYQARKRLANQVSAA